jgi:hypothetical protein
LLSRHHMSLYPNCVIKGGHEGLAITLSEIQISSCVKFFER